MKRTSSKRFVSRIQVNVEGSGRVFPVEDSCVEDSIEDSC